MSASGGRNRWQLIAAVVGVVVVSLLALLFVGNVLNESADDTAVDVTDVEEGKVAQEVFDDVEPGVKKEELLARLRPALPVDTRVLARYQARSPETVGSSCVYYEAAGADRLYRFCFVDDQLVDKIVISPDGVGPAG